MSRTTSPVVYVAVCAAVVIVAGLVYFGVKNYRASKEREAKRMEEVLNTPLGDVRRSGPRRFGEEVPGPERLRRRVMLYPLWG